jgi:AraC-like DNA-binding protein
MLEATGQSVDAIAAEIGYEDASFFARLFRRKVGMTPVQYRRRFGGLRAALRAAGQSAEPYRRNVDRPAI